MSERPTEARRSTRLAWVALLGSLVVVLMLGLLTSSILERRAERNVARIQIIQPVGQWETDNSKWGVNFPREYHSWEATKQMNENTKHGGSGYRDYLKENPRLVILFAGYGFGEDYSAPRGHYHSLYDVQHTGRITPKTPATCWTCKSPDVPRLMHERGVKQFYASTFADIKAEIRNPIGCLDCHDPNTMALRISRPALREAFEARGEDITRASQQEKRTLVCAQCHVSYYFTDKKTNYLKFPWDDGFSADDFDKYYERVGFSDWTHPISGVRMIKLRHPEYEIWKQGVHAFRGVSCADCHMPYKSQGGVKFTDHQVRSPLYNMESSCQVCHRWSEGEIWERVTSIQDKTNELRNIAEDALVRAHVTVGDAAAHGSTDQELQSPRHTLRRAQMYWDFIAANNGMGFHAPQEAARVLAKATNLAQECRLETERIRARRGLLEPAPMPDLSTREKAHAYIEPFVAAAKARAAKANP